MKLTVVGGGNMGLTYAKGIDKAGLLSEQISILEKGNDNVKRLKAAEPQFLIESSPSDCIKKSNII